MSLNSTVDLSHLTQTQAVHYTPTTTHYTLYTIHHNPLISCSIIVIIPWSSRHHQPAAY